MNDLYRIRQKIFSWINRYEIYHGDSESVAFSVKRRIGFWWPSFTFYDSQGKEVLKCVSRGFLRPRYLVTSAEQMVGEIRPSFSYYFPKIHITDLSKQPISIMGSLPKREFSFVQNEEVIGRVSRQLWSWADAFGTEILSGKNRLLILAAVVIIDHRVFDPSVDSSR
jgi:uncharacterized protein YxjI